MVAAARSSSVRSVTKQRNETESVNTGVFLFRGTLTSSETSGAAAARGRRHNGRGKKGKQTPNGGTEEIQTKSADASDNSSQTRNKWISDLWEPIERDVARIMQRQNDEVFDSIIEFARRTSRASRKAETALGTDGQNKQPERVADAFAEVPCAVLLTGINTPDHTLLFESLGTRICANLTPFVATISSKECRTLRAAMKVLVDAFIDCDSPTSATSAQVYARDMTGLLAWYTRESEKTRGRPLVVVVEDFEGMDAVTLSDLIVVCSHYRSLLPVFFIVGVASSPAAIPRHLSRRALTLVNTAKFKVKHSSVTLCEVVERIFLGQGQSGDASSAPILSHCFRLGPKPFQELLDSFLYHNLSVYTFLRGLKYAMVRLFCADNVGNVAVLVRSIAAGADKAIQHADLETVRQFPAFRELVEGTDAVVEKKKLLTDDAHLTTVLGTLWREHCQRDANHAFAVRCLTAVCQQFPSDAHQVSTFLPSVYVWTLSASEQREPVWGRFLDVLRVSNISALGTLVDTVLAHLGTVPEYVCVSPVATLIYLLSFYHTDGAGISWISCVVWGWHIRLGLDRRLCSFHCIPLWGVCVWLLWITAGVFQRNNR
eukprot:m.1142437 g.1142437  ORF g.1142437 m.1142437 type:complete len:601 (-) comp24455_c0_seq4:2799-4601(-)